MIVLSGKTIDKQAKIGKRARIAARVFNMCTGQLLQFPQLRLQYTHGAQIYVTGSLVASIPALGTSVVYHQPVNLEDHHFALVTPAILLDKVDAKHSGHIQKNTEEQKNKRLLIDIEPAAAFCRQYWFMLAEQFSAILFTGQTEDFFPI